MINAQTANRLDLLLADCRGEISYRRLPTRHAGKEMVRDLDSVVARAKAQYAADRRSAALERRGV